MIIAGIDEAGYGPLLGPLTVGCCAFEVADAESSPSATAAENLDGVADDAETATATAAVVKELPCIWSRLRRYVGKTRSRSGKTLHINDSKQVYSPSTGIRELERSVLALATATRGWPGSLDGLLAAFAPHALAELAEHPWYVAPPGEAFPLSQDGLPIQLFAKSLAAEMDSRGARCVELSARVLAERPYNRMVAATRNKASVLFTQSATLLDQLVRRFASRGLHVFCDRQGGRSNYGSQLRLLFEDWSLEILREQDGRSDYALHRAGQTVFVTWSEKAEAKCLPVAVASMIAKYLRESLMERFNAWWKTHAPQVEPTAGYYTDGMRWLEQTAELRRQLGVKDEHLVRLK